MLKIKIRRITKKEKTKLGITGARPIKYRYVEKKVKGKKIRIKLN